MSQKDLDYDAIDEQLDKELFEAIFGTSELSEGMTHADAIGKTIASALSFEDVEDLIEMPSRETFDEWIRLGEERRKQREKMESKE